MMFWNNFTLETKKSDSSAGSNEFLLNKISPNSNLKLIDALDLGPARALYLVQVNEQKFLLGSNSNSLFLISQIEDSQKLNLEEKPQTSLPEKEENNICAAKSPKQMNEVKLDISLPEENLNGRNFEKKLEQPEKPQFQPYERKTYSNVVERISLSDLVSEESSNEYVAEIESENNMSASSLNEPVQIKEDIKTTQEEILSRNENENNDEIEENDLAEEEIEEIKVKMSEPECRQNANISSYEQLSAKFFLQEKTQTENKVEQISSVEDETNFSTEREIQYIPSRLANYLNNRVLRKISAP